MNNDYDLTPETITSWAVEYASYTELEQVAKALYGLYVQRRKVEQPKKHKEVKQKKKHKSVDAIYWRYKKPKGVKLDEYKQKPFVMPKTIIKK
jgi:hypothetical protein